MSRQTWAALAAALVATAAAIVLYLDNRGLQRELSALKARPAPVARDPWATPTLAEPIADGDDGPGLPGIPRGLGGAIDSAGRPDLPDEPKETRMQRRARRQQELAALLGRDADETEEEYRARVMPLMEALLARPRENVAEMRREAEAAAGVSDEQRAKLDAAFEGVYDEVLTFTNGAVADGQLSPYERNVSGLLEYAGGLGAILGGAETQVGSILSPSQLQTMYDAGFEWGEYLGLAVPWEQLKPPPPRPGDSGG